MYPLVCELADRDAPIRVPVTVARGEPVVRVAKDPGISESCLRRWTRSTPGARKV